MPGLHRILIANRGEIAVRVIRACRELGVSPVAVCSDVDVLSEHVRLADSAVRLGGMTAAESYLRVDKIVAAAQESGADAVHPGYGFLSEKAELAQALAEAGITLIGPPAAVMRTMGDKVAAKRAATAAGVPVVPGLAAAAGEALEEVGRRAALQVGLPLLVKAAYGGGGKGMRIVREPHELERAVREAAREAKTAFGDGALYFERFLSRPRHIEIQVFADNHGAVTHLGERECSIQRRHQKLIEETPSTAVGAALRARMGDAAVALARACGYRGAGTVEFLLDEDGSFYFIEMNTRLQVEHTVTEMVTGVDLVQEQIRVAGGEPLSFTAPPPPRGHAIQCRIGAEDTSADFAPSTGKVVCHRPPRGPHVRCDDGLGDGGEVSLYYDPMFAKLVVWGASRAQAIARMEAALREYLIAGVHTTIPFHLHVLADPDFRAGRTDITYVANHWPPPPSPQRSRERAQAELIAAALEHRERELRVPLPVGDAAAWRGRGRHAALRTEVR